LRSASGRRSARVPFSFSIENMFPFTEVYGNPGPLALHVGEQFDERVEQSDLVGRSLRHVATVRAPAA